MKLRNKRTNGIGYLQNDSSVGKLRILNDNNDTIGEYTTLAELNAEWEDYEEPKEYWSYDTFDNEVTFNSISNEDDRKADQEIGNYFNTREEAKKAVEKLKAVKRLKDNGFRFTKWKFRDVLEGDLVIEAKLNFFPSLLDNTSSVQRDLEICFGGEE